MFTIPNLADTVYPDQAELDKVDIDILAQAISGDGIVSGCAVTAQGTPNMTVAVASGQVGFSGTGVTVSSGNVTITAANGTYSRFDLVVANSSGVKSVTAGTPDANPVFPAVPANSTVLAAVFVPANDTAIQSDQIIDKRLFIDLPPAGPAQAQCGVSVYMSVNDTSGDNGDVLAWNLENFDTHGFHDNSTNNSRLTVPSNEGGLYLVGIYVAPTAPGVSNTTGVQLRKGGSTVVMEVSNQADASANTGDVGFSFPIVLAASEYVEAVFQTNVATRTILAARTSFWMVRQGI